MSAILAALLVLQVYSAYATYRSVIYSHRSGDVGRGTLVVARAFDSCYVYTGKCVRVSRLCRGDWSVARPAKTCPTP